MVDADKDEFKLVMAAMAEVYRVECPNTLQKSYWLVCQPMTIQQFQKAAAKAMRTLKWFPKPAELFELSGSNPEDDAMRAWAVFTRAIDDLGGYQSPKFEDGVLVATIESLGGWRHVCGMPVGEFESFFRARFFDTYKSYQRQGITSNRPLVGIHDHSKGRITNNEPVRIGSVLSECLEKRLDTRIIL